MGVISTSYINTTKGDIQVKDLIGIPFSIILEGITFQSQGFNLELNDELYKIVSIDKKEVYVNKDQKVYTFIDQDWNPTEVYKLRRGIPIAICNPGSTIWNITQTTVQDSPSLNWDQ